MFLCCERIPFPAIDHDLTAMRTRLTIGTIFGILLILSVLFFPNGLVRIPEMIRRKWNS